MSLPFEKFNAVGYIIWQCIILLTKQDLKVTLNVYDGFIMKEFGQSNTCDIGFVCGHMTILNHVPI